MTMIFHHHILEEQVRAHRREIEIWNREAWKWMPGRTGKNASARGGRLTLAMWLGRMF
ncbi:hypothetical protein [Cohnella nanjingensis]|uniref:Uncharacterized protein n=1 Tax=Cohnella nanjingensis TaxID=1387779 RepID=A0A7X0RZE5_9BACL|nr:hypothetical protein [Cohnella nanjingensis]MBB6675120.1 hypothetical protein [Cohnella nanjingensis]